jgi:hypothetical protein
MSKRGHYKLYREESNKISKQPTTDNDMIRLSMKISKFQSEIREEFQISHYRAKLLANLQGVKDLITKEIKRNKISTYNTTTLSESNEFKRISEQLEEIKDNQSKLEERINNIEANQVPYNLVLDLENLDNSE